MSKKRKLLIYTILFALNVFGIGFSGHFQDKITFMICVVGTISAGLLIIRQIEIP